MVCSKWMAAARLATVLGLAMALSACATVLGGTTQEVFIETDPPGAECKLDRLGASVAWVKPTPGRANVSRSKETMVVTCVLNGYEQANDTLSSSFTGATFGNILVGGLVGIAVDAASGANNKYPERITVIMTPASFPTDAARDAHFAAAKARVTAAADTEIQRLRNSCNTNNRELCREQEKPITEGRDRAIEEIERKRLAAKIVPQA
jgi:hypothetical protein